jgi:hypothetical protein
MILFGSGKRFWIPIAQSLGQHVEKRPIRTVVGKTHLVGVARRTNWLFIRHHSTAVVVPRASRVGRPILK